MVRYFRSSSCFVFVTATTMLSSCGTKDDKNKITFATVNTILTNHCGTSSCHASGAAQPVYLDAEVTFKAFKATVIDRVNTKRDMPPSDATAAQQAISDADRTTLQNYLLQY